MTRTSFCVSHKGTSTSCLPGTVFRDLLNVAAKYWGESPPGCLLFDENHIAWSVESSPSIMWTSISAVYLAPSTPSSLSRHDHRHDNIALCTIAAWYDGIIVLQAAHRQSGGVGELSRFHAGLHDAQIQVRYLVKSNGYHYSKLFPFLIFNCYLK